MYCTKCGHYIKDDATVCEKCGASLIKDRELNPEELHELSKALHDREHKSREEIDNAMVFIVLGTTLLIIGFLFLFLSNKMDMETFEKHISIKCFEFWVSMAGLSSGGVLFVLGIIRLIKQKAVVHRRLLKSITSIQNNNYKHLDN